MLGIALPMVMGILAVIAIITASAAYVLIKNGDEERRGKEEKVA